MTQQCPLHLSSVVETSVIDSGSWCRVTTWVWAGRDAVRLWMRYGEPGTWPLGRLCERSVGATRPVARRPTPAPYDLVLHSFLAAPARLAYTLRAIFFSDRHYFLLTPTKQNIMSDKLCSLYLICVNIYGILNNYITDLVFLFEN